MGQSRRVAVTFSAGLLQDLEWLATLDKRTRSAVVSEAVGLYVAERKRREMREQLRRGYQEMAPINLVLAEEGLIFEAHVTGAHGQDRQR